MRETGMIFFAVLGLALILLPASAAALSISESPKQPRYLTLTVSLLRKKTLRWTYYWETPAVLPA